MSTYRNPVLVVTSGESLEQLFVPTAANTRRLLVVETRERKPINCIVYTIAIPAR